MKRRFSIQRAGIFLVATGLLFLIGGDRGVTQIPQGIDPLEVLNLQIKPNVAVLLDTSGSMTETPYGNGTLGDHPGSKMFQAKQVLKSVITANQSNVNFLFGTYLFAAPPPSWTICPGGGCTNGPGGGPGGDYRIGVKPNRFRYSTQSWDATTVPPFPIQGPSPAMATAATEASLNSLYAYQWIQNTAAIQNNQLRFTEGATVCTATIPPGFYATPAALGVAIAAAMDPCGPNTYTVTYGTVTANRFTFTRATGAAAFTLNWNDPLTTIDGPLNMVGAGTQVPALAGTPPALLATTFNDPRINLLARTTTDELNGEMYDPDGTAGPSPVRGVNTHWLYAQKLWNGETVQVDGAGNACNIIAATPPAAANPTVTLQRLAACGGAVVSTNVFVWSGGTFGGVGACQVGFDQRVPFFNCRADVVQPGIQSTTIQPFMQNELPLNGTGGITGYTESLDGTGDILTTAANGGVVAAGNTPMSQSFDGFRAKFLQMWTTGQALPFPQNLSAISTHPSPKEKTIVIMVTDGDQNCTPFVLGNGTLGAPYGPGIIQSDGAALGAAAATQRLYNPALNGTGAGTVNADGTINGDPGASVTTYVVGFGNGGQINRLNWIAWGGSGMQRGTGLFGGQQTWTTVPTTAERNACLTCVDAFIAPDAATLTDILTKLLNQGATTGEFTAQQSITDSVLEYVGESPFPNTPASLPAPDSFNPGTRYLYLSPIRINASFTMPLFTGQVRAFTADGPDALSKPTATCNGNITACERWDANARLVNRVSTGMTAGCPANALVGNTVGQCNFRRLAGYPAATDFNIRTSTAGIKRRIYTTSQNGVFGPTVDNLLLNQSPFRIALWPPQQINPKQVAPQDDTSEGLFDVAMGLPADSAPAGTHGALFTGLQNQYKACTGAPLPGSCGGSATQQMKRARREAREMILAFLAGAQFAPDNNGNPRRAVNSAAPDYTAGDILFAARTAILAESTLATPALVGAPQDEEPVGTPWIDEYKLYKDGPRCPAPGNCTPVTAGGTAYSPDSPNGSLISAGFGLRNPDRTAEALDPSGQPLPTPDTRNSLKPVMTVNYVGTNSALHAFRAGPNVATGPGVRFTPVQPPAVPVIPNNNPVVCVPSSTTECGGEELWAFVPFDQLGKLPGRYLTNPQKRTPHDYMIARGIRFSDVFVPNPGTIGNPDPTPVTKTNVAGTNISLTLTGVWRKVMVFGRGAGGKHLTVMDVTGPGPFTRLSLDTPGPIVLWNRGNPDTIDGTPGGQPNNGATGPGTDYDAYLRMGQTWSVPAIGVVDRNRNITGRKAAGADFVAYVGSGYGPTAATPAQGTTFYTLDVLTGDVVKSVDVGFRTGMAYENALVANPVLFNTSRFIYQRGGVPAPNVAAALATRVYFGDLHGRAWKVLSASPDIAITMADLGSNQAVATAGAILGLPANDPAKKPHVMISSGQDSRATGPFNNFGFIDDGDDTTTTVQAGVVANGVTSFPPVRSLFTVPFDTNFRGTVQPLVVYSDTASRTAAPNDAAGRVFFVGTRFNPVGSQFAPTDEPCRSSFDSELFALGVESGLAAYDFGPSRLFQNSRVAAVTVAADPKGSKLIIDEGLVKTGQPVPPPPAMGQAPSQTSSKANVVPLSRPGDPLASVRLRSTVCE